MTDVTFFTIGIAARDIKMGELISYNPCENTDDILINQNPTEAKLKNIIPPKCAVTGCNGDMHFSYSAGQWDIWVCDKCGEENVPESM